MVQVMERPRIGQYILTKELMPGALGPRHLALHELDSSSHILHRPPIGRDRSEQRRFLSGMAAARGLSHPHMLAIEESGLDNRGHPYVVTPFTGDATGIVTVETLLRAKGGFFSLTEAKQAVVQALEATDYAHRCARAHGPISMGEVLVDRRGRVVLELYGVARILNLVHDGVEDLESEEVRSIIRIGYQLVTGLVPEEPLIAAGRVVPGLDAVWDDWFETGLHGPGFKSAAHALSAIRDRLSLAAAERSVGRVRGVIGRLLFSR